MLAQPYRKLLERGTRGMRNAIIIVLTLFPLLSFARPFEGVPQDRVKDIFVITEDGVTEKLIHLSNPGKPILLLEPGLGAQGLSLELPATALYLRGEYDIFIGNWRGSTKLPRGAQTLSDQNLNGLHEVVRKDFPAHLRHILHNYATPEQLQTGISLLGHSMGGMMIMGALSDPALLEEFSPFVKRVVLFQSPHHVAYLKKYFHWIAKIGIPALKKLKSLGVESIDTHSRALHLTKQTKLKGGVLGKLVVPAIENIALLLTKLAIAPQYTGRQKLREAFFKMSADRIPVDLLLDFAYAALNQGRFTDRNGQPLIAPERIKDIAVMIVRAKLDTLAPWQQQEEYFKALGSKRKQMLSIEEMNHTDTVLFTRQEADFMHYVLDFLGAETLQEGLEFELDFTPQCERLLRKQ